MILSYARNLNLKLDFFSKIFRGKVFFRKDLKIEIKKLIKFPDRILKIKLMELQASWGILLLFRLN